MLVKYQFDKAIIVHSAEDLILEPVVVYVNKFDEESSRQFILDMSAAHNTGQKIIPVVIDSFGGDVYALNSMLDTVKNSALPVATIVLGKAMSCASVLASSGTKQYRFCAPSSTFMIHDVSSESWGKSEDIKADSKETDRLNELLYSLLDKNAGKKKGYFWNLVKENNRADLYFDAKHSLEHGLVDHIGIPTLTTTVTFQQKLEIE